MTPSPAETHALREAEREIHELLLGNREWASERVRADPSAFHELDRVHRPPFMLVGCCDARKPMDLVTGSQPGRLFLHRNVGNQVRMDDPAIGASLEFGLGVLGVRHLIVCGHTGCGGIQASLLDDPGGDLGVWTAPVRGLAREHAEELDALVDFRNRTDALSELNVIRQLENALEHPAVRSRLAERERPLYLHGWMFILKLGLIEPLELPWSRWKEEGRLPQGVVGVVEP